MFGSSVRNSDGTRKDAQCVQDLMGTRFFLVPWNLSPAENSFFFSELHFAKKQKKKTTTTKKQTFIFNSSILKKAY